MLQGDVYGKAAVIMIFGYARVSTARQHEDRQTEALLEFGIPPDRIYVDKMSGKDTNRENYQRLRNDILREGDTLVVKELDRLSRSKSDIKAELEYFNKLRIRVVILDIPTTKIEYENTNKWVFELINNILIEVLGSLAEEERNKISRRQREGIDSAKKKGTRFGRPSISKPRNWNSVIESMKNGEITAVQAMSSLKLKKTTFYKLLKEHNE